MTTGNVDPEKTDNVDGTSTTEGENVESELEAQKTLTAKGKKAEGEKVFTQEQVNELVGKIRVEARDVTTKQVTESLLKELGMESKEKLADLVKSAETARKAAMTEQERVATELKAAQDKVIELEKLSAEQGANALAANIKAVVVSKAATKFVDAEAAYKLLDMASLSVNDAGEIVGVDEALTSLAEKYPWMLGKKASTTSAANPDRADGTKGKSDEARRAEYFGQKSGDFWQGGGARKITETE